MKLNARIAFTLAAIVLASSLAGGFAGFRWGHSKARQRSNPETWNVAAMRTLERRLHPTPEQRARWQEVIDRGVAEMKQTRLETIQRTNAIVQGMVATVEKDLTPEQQAEFARLKPPPDSATLEVLKVEPRAR